ncbi:hypothetical protein PR202_gb22671 [Eleusine coracana subsp. coracana]|uniref:Uncharacterized protein n=1 Tax=Eleusine coracana subsp. coracana TaxID=191504 RepID=A0AAV5FGR9_ELECO|nr:hypothetical protein PR202_gb22671 [Eleusine coracana subsp. coracana]
MSASVSNAKLMDRHEISKELQCTADSRLDALPKDQCSPVMNLLEVAKPGSQLEGVSTSCEGNQAPETTSGLEAKERKKDKKDKKRKRDKKDDPEYLEKKRLKKEKKRMEKETARKQQEGEGVPSSEQNIVKPSISRDVSLARPPIPMRSAEPAPAQSSEPQVSSKETTVDTARTAPTPKIRIRVKPLQRRPEGT